MPKVEIPRDILWDMQQSGLLAEMLLGNDLFKSQAVEVTSDLEVWCRQKAEAIRKNSGPNAATANNLDIVGDAIRRALTSN